MEPENVEFEDSGSVPVSVEPTLVAGRLAKGATLAGGRYEIVGLLGQGVFGEIYRATDRRSEGLPVALRLLSPDLLADPQAVDRLRRELETVRGLDHKNLAKVLDFGVESDRAFVVTEHVDGQSLRALMQKKRAAGGSPGVFSLKGAYNVVAHVCNALAFVHKRTIHGAMSTANVLVNKAGRVKVTELGLSRALPRFSRSLGDPADRGALAPEMAASPASADARADVYSTAAILYELLTGRAPAPDFARPSAVVNGLPPQLDQVIARCLSPHPADRLPDMMAVKAALHAILEGRPVAAAAGSGAVLAHPSTTRATAPPIRPTAVATAAPRTPPTAASATGLPAQPVAGLARSAGSLLPGMPGATASSPLLPRPSGARTVAFDENEEKWLVQKGKLDFGPFSFAQIKEQIARDEILPEHIIVDNESGTRQRVDEHPLLSDLVLAAAERRDQLRRAQAEAVVVKQSKRRGVVLYAFIGLGVIVLGLGAYFVVSKLSSSEKKETGEIASLEGAELNVTIQLAPPEPKKTRAKRTGARRSEKDPGFDDTIDLGNAEDGEESETLDNAQINAVLSKHGNALGRCLLSSGERRANIVFIIRGNGKVSDVMVNGQTGSALAGCVRSRMQAMQFPTFNGPRTKAQFDMSL